MDRVITIEDVVEFDLKDFSKREKDKDFKVPNLINMAESVITIDLHEDNYELNNNFRK